jgi:predicted metal-binding membrane protein
MNAADARAPRTVAMLLACSALAWLALVAVSALPWEAAFEHGALENIGAHRWELSTLAAGWVLMVTAMMLPTTQPLVALFARLTAARPDRARLLAIVLAVYMLVWVVIGVVMHLADFGIHRLVDHSKWLDAHSWTILAATLALAGGYQLSGLKERCASRCRTPQGFIRRHWHGRSAAVETTRLALDHALSCVGCCWALMLVMFSVGVGSVACMVALAAVMTAEKMPGIGRRLSTPVAFALLAGALATAIAG